jgi:hypothetical protein
MEVIFYPVNILITFLIICFLLQGTYVEGIKEEVVLSPAHCLSLIATGEGDNVVRKWRVRK